jgi:hypothetical protein
MPLTRSSESGYLAKVRALPCLVCGKRPSEAHHHTGRRGMGQKSSDSDAMPLCHECHMAFHNGAGRFKDETKKQRREFQDFGVVMTKLRLTREDVF